MYLERKYKMFPLSKHRNQNVMGPIIYKYNLLQVKSNGQLKGHGLFFQSKRMVIPVILNA